MQAAFQSLPCESDSGNPATQLERNPEHCANVALSSITGEGYQIVDRVLKQFPWNCRWERLERRNNSPIRGMLERKKTVAEARRDSAVSSLWPRLDPLQLWEPGQVLPTPCIPTCSVIRVKEACCAPLVFSPCPPQHPEIPCALFTTAHAHPQVCRCPVSCTNVWHGV